VLVRVVLSNDPCQVSRRTTRRDHARSPGPHTRTVGHRDVQTLGSSSSTPLTALLRGAAWHAGLGCPPDCRIHEFPAVPADLRAEDLASPSTRGDEKRQRWICAAAVTKEQLLAPQTFLTSDWEDGAAPLGAPGDYFCLDARSTAVRSSPGIRALISFDVHRWIARLGVWSLKERDVGRSIRDRTARAPASARRDISCP